MTLHRQSVKLSSIICYILLTIVPTYDHRILRTRLPVRSALFKQDTGELVVRWVTTSESPLLYVFGRFLPSYPHIALGGLLALTPYPRAVTIVSPPYSFYLRYMPESMSPHWHLQPINARQPSLTSCPGLASRLIKTLV
jgi:hypothetical protein